ncbi:MAG: GTPase HflX [Limnochordia bacterium]|jgi:GTP-binding protein HflX
MKAVLFAVDAHTPGLGVDESLVELGQLASSAGATVVDELVQRREAPDASTYLGTGKVLELAELMEDLDAELAICDDELTPAQAGNLSERLDRRVVDRTQLILDIFASRAQSREGKVQVELAQLRYLLPRLAGQGLVLSRLGGGIGTRGPGETKLESDRRHIRRRIAELRRELDRIRQRRRLQRESRQASHVPVVALVGYTNAGKSTLLNALSGASVPTQDHLFSTLDPTVRGVELPRYEQRVCIVDTVGFIRKLPHDLIAAFRATLEEVVGADMLVHVVDSSHPQMWQQMEAVQEVLVELGAADKLLVTAFNKKDRQEPQVLATFVARTPHSCTISARSGEGCMALLELVEELLPERYVVRAYRIPYSDAGVVSWLHASARVLHEEFDGDAARLKVAIRQQLAEQVRRFEEPL